MEEIEWCLDQRKGIKLVEPNDNLSDAYFKKAEDALETMNSINSPDWIISTGYYCMYYSLYAVLMKAGIKSEMHTCTIECMKECFGKFFRSEDMQMIENARISRVQSQYSVTADTVMDEMADIVANAPVFLLKCRHVCGLLKRDDIDNIRKKLSGGHFDRH